MRPRRAAVGPWRLRSPTRRPSPPPSCPGTWSWREQYDSHSRREPLMEFALFYEIPVPAPWGPDSERDAYRSVIEQAVAGERHGWDAFWTVEHHFLSEFSHCSNPEVLYGAVAALTRRIRLGYGVRLMPY